MMEKHTDLKNELEGLKERNKKLAKQKSYLQLIMNLINRLSLLHGLEDIAEAIVRIVIDSVGGTKVCLYYFIDTDIFCIDALNEKKKLKKIDDSFVQKAFDTGELVEDEHEFYNTLMSTAEFSKALTWAQPLIVGNEIVGVLKTEGMVVGARDSREQLQAFFNFAALALKNEILGYSRLQKAHDQLTQVNNELSNEIIERKKIEKALQQAKDELEQKVLERTEELRKINEQLHIELEERKKAQEALKTSEEKFRSYIEYSPLGIFIADASGHYIDCNLAAHEMIGYTREELLSKTIQDLLPPQEIESVTQIFLKFIEDGYLKGEFNLHRKDKSVIPVLLESVVMPKSKLVLTFCSDITNRKLADEKLRNQLVELQRWQNVTMGREERIMVLKDEVNDLLTKLGQPLRYSNREASGEDK